MMSLLTPYWLLLGLLAVPILVLYMLKMRRREVHVSSNMLWEILLRDRQANTPWQRLRRNLLLFLQLLLLGALVFSLARPAIQVPSLASGSVVVLVDASASMNAADTGRTRFEIARLRARDLIDGLDSHARMTLVLVGRQPVVLASGESDKNVLRRALETASVENGSANWQSAFALAAAAAGGDSLGDGESKKNIVIISDGGAPAEGLPPLPGDVRYLPVGESAENLAISALAIRPAAVGPELFAQATNYGKEPHSVLLSFYVDDQLFRSQQIDINPGQNNTMILTDLPPEAVIYQARLSSLAAPDRSPDWLPLDDSAFAVYQPGGTRRVLLVTANPQGNLFLEQMLAAMPGVRPYRALAGEDGKIQLPAEPFDLIVLDGIVPPSTQEGQPTLPEGSLLFVNPPENPLFEVGGIFTNTNLVETAQSPLMQYVDWSGVHVLKARQVQIPLWAEVLVRSEGGALVFAGQTGSQRVAVLTFDLHESDLPLQVAYPILFANLLNYLAPGQAINVPEGLQPGEGLEILPDTNVKEVGIVTPSGKVASYLPGEASLHFLDTSELGIYAVNYFYELGQSVEYFAVNLFDPLESNIQPAESIHVGRTSIPVASTKEIGQREFWPWLVLLALLTLYLEWWVYHRQQRLTGYWDSFTGLVRKAISSLRGFRFNR